MKYIRMKNGYTAIVDDEEFHCISNTHWNPQKQSNGKVYAVGNIIVDGKTQRVPLHRYLSGASKHQIVDFINENTLDCRKENMKLISRGLHHRRNKKMKFRLGKKCTSVFKGVHFDKISRKWKAYISKNGKAKYLGRFETQIEAADAYNDACHKIAGDYAYENIPKLINNILSNQTEEVRKIKKGTVPLKLGKILISEILYNVEDSIGDSDALEPKTMIVYSSIIRKLTDKMFLFNRDEIICIFKEFPRITNQQLLNNRELENEAMEFLAQNPYLDLFNEINKKKYLEAI